MAAVIDCPSCKRKLQLPDDALGMQVRCPSCSFTFTAELACDVRLPPPLRPVLLHEEPPAEPRPKPARLGTGRIGDEPCPACGRPVPDDALRCAYCGEYLEEEDDRPWEQPGRVRRDCEQQRGGLIGTLGIISLACAPIAVTCCFALGLGAVFGIAGMATGIPAWVMGQKDLAKMREYIMDPAGRPMTQAGMICGIIGTILSAIGVLLHAGQIAFWVLH